MQIRAIWAGLLVPVLALEPFGVTSAAAQPAPPPTYPTPPAPNAAPSRYAAPPNPGAEVQFAPDEPDLQLYSLSGVTPYEVVRYHRRYWGGYYGVGYGWAPEYSPVCGQACRTRLTPGAYRFALSKDGGRAVPVPGPTVIRGPAVLRGSYTDRSGLRIAGWVIGIAGLVGGVVMIVDSVHDHEVCDENGFCYEHETADGGLLAGGIGVILLTGIAGSVLVAQRDQAFITVEPLRLSSYGRAREADAATGGYPRAQGAALALHF